MGSFTKREQIVILVIVFIIIFLLGFKILFKDIIDLKKDKMEIRSIEENIIGEDFTEDEDNYNETIMVHISGQVYNPGLIELEMGKRVNDAVEMAGGLKKDADMDRINLAKKLEDEEKIYIPKIGEDLPNELENSTTTTTNSKESGKIDINTCTKGELVTLPGIGDVLADRILDYRTSNKFIKIEDIMNVSGIGEKKFDSIKDLIKVK